MSREGREPWWSLLVAIVLLGSWQGYKAWTAHVEKTHAARRQNVSTDVVRNFDRYIAQGTHPADVENALRAEVRRRTRAAGLENPEARLHSASQQWTWLQTTLRNLEQDSLRLDTLQAESLAKCAPAFGDDCEEIIDAWLCLGHGRCSEGAREALSILVLEKGELEEELEEHCPEVVDIESICSSEEPPEVEFPDY